jgi:cytoskeleton protein RodZ
MSATADSAAASSVGERLRAARDRQGLTLQKISEDLHLDMWILEAMEEDRFRALGAPVYARGYLRKYAQLLGLDVDAVLSQYEATHTGPVAPNLVPKSVDHPAMSSERPRVWPLAAAVVGALAVIGSAIWVWFVRPHALRPEPTAAPTVATGAANPSAADTRATATHIDTAAAPPVAAVSHQGANATPAGVARARLRLSFSADSWVEIYDAADQRLIYDQGAASSTRAVTGAPPLRVLLGNFSGVELALDGRPIAIPDRARNGATARFRILASGTTLPGWGP